MSHAPATPGGRFATLVRSVCAAPEVHSARKTVVYEAARLLCTPWVGLARYGSERRMRFVASSDDVVRRIGRIASALHEGPSWQLYADAAQLLFVRDLTRESRWPMFRQAVLEQLPVRSALGVAVGIAPPVVGATARPEGALMLYSDDADRFAEHQLAEQHLEEIRSFAEAASFGLALVNARQKAANLEIALRTSREIGIAIGIVMERLRLSEEDAFDALRSASQNRQVKLRELAARVVLTGELPATS